MQTTEAIAPRDKRVIQALLWALKPLSNLRRRSIPLPYAVAFLTVALEEGKPVGRYAQELDLNRYVMTRYMQCIGDRGRNGEPGLGLVTIRRTDGIRPGRKFSSRTKAERWRPKCFAAWAHLSDN